MGYAADIPLKKIPELQTAIISTWKPIFVFFFLLFLTTKNCHSILLKNKTNYYFFRNKLYLSDFSMPFTILFFYYESIIELCLFPKANRKKTLIKKKKKKKTNFLFFFFSLFYLKNEKRSQSPKVFLDNARLFNKVIRKYPDES